MPIGLVQPMTIVRRSIAPHICFRFHEWKGVACRNIEIPESDQCHLPNLRNKRAISFISLVHCVMLIVVQWLSLDRQIKFVSKVVHIVYHVNHTSPIYHHQQVGTRKSKVTYDICSIQLASNLKLSLFMCFEPEVFLFRNYISIECAYDYKAAQRWPAQSSPVLSQGMYSLDVFIQIIVAVQSE